MKFNIYVGAILVFVAVWLVACTVPQTKQNPDGTQSTVQVVDPKLEEGIVVARATNAATAPINPFAALVDWGLGTLAVGATLVAKLKNDRAAKSELLLKTVVQAVDAVDNQSFKDAISTHASNIGVEGDLNRIVKQVGSGTI